MLYFGYLKFTLQLWQLAGILVDILSTSAHKYPFEQTTRSILFNTIVENRRHLNSRRSFIIAAGELERVGAALF